MKQNKRLRKCLIIFLTAALILQAVSCGYFMYPERRGQKGGKIDPGVAILDAIGLLFFIIPGLVAFAVDFTNGTIYLPSGKRSGVQPPDYAKILEIPVPPGKLNKHGIEALVQEHTGQAITLDSENVQIFELADIKELPEAFNKLSEK